MNKDDAIIEFYGPVIRIGIVGKWVHFITREKRPTRKELLMLIERTHLRVSCLKSRTSEHSSPGARGRNVRMFGCLPLDGPHREGGLLAGLRTYLPLRSHSLDATTFWSAKIGCSARRSFGEDGQ